MIRLAHRHIIPAAYSLLPPAMNTPEATAHLLTIGLQESKFLARRQVLPSGRRGPASGLWQFERGGGVHGVLTHRTTKQIAIDVLRELRYGGITGTPIEREKAVHATIEHNDVLACVFARLLLWTVPARLPRRGEAAIAWGQYLAAWRPGKPHPETWERYFAEAWQRVDLVSETEEADES